jgi:hypothetical protein
MITLKRWGFAGLAAMLLTTGAVGAATPAPAYAAAPDAPTRADAQALAHLILEGMGFKSMMTREMEPFNLQFSHKSRPQWPAMARETFAAVIDEKMPAIEQIVGDRMAADFTPGELRAGLAFLSSPTGKAAISGGGPLALTPGQRAELDAFTATPDGKAFTHRLDTLTDILRPVLGDIVVLVIPEYMRRLGERAEAAEAAHPAPRLLDKDAGASARAIAAVVYAHSDFRAQFIAVAAPVIVDNSVRPEWPAMMSAATGEALDVQQPQIEGLMAAAFAHDLSPKALADGADFLTTPVGLVTLQQTLDATAGRKTDPMPPIVQAAVDAYVKTPDGLAFVREIALVRKMLSASTDDIEPRILPGAFKRFGEKAQAAEAGRQRVP